jgi:hypothetical protein
VFARDDQSRWWQEMLEHVDGGGVVHDCSPTDVWNRGGRDHAGFVQMCQGASNDPDRLRHMYVNQQPVRMGPLRPEVIGGLLAWHSDDGCFTLSAYFTSEAETRSGENLEEFESFFDDIHAVMQDVTYIDLRDPWLSSPRHALLDASSAQRNECRDLGM